MKTTLSPFSTVSLFFYVAVNISQKRREPLFPRKLILKFFPFDSMNNRLNNCSHFLSFLMNLLGSTNSDRNALHPKPFSTSVQNVSQFCNYYYHQDLHWNLKSTSLHSDASTFTSRSSTHGKNTSFFPWSCISEPFERHPFSGLNLSVGELLRIHYRMTASMSTFQLSMKFNTFCGV